VVVPDPDVSGNMGLGYTRSVFWVAKCFARPIVKALPPKNRGKDEGRRRKKKERREGGEGKE
jgi:hypothetical protein